MRGHPQITFVFSVAGISAAPIYRHQPSYSFRVSQTRRNQCVTFMSASRQSATSGTTVAGGRPKLNRALIFDCDGVIVESEELHRLSYNQCWASENLGFEWSYEFYEMLQNTVGGGKEKMCWYFERYGWPDTAVTDAEREALVSHLHRKKTQLYKDLIVNGDAKIRPGVLRLMDEAHEKGYKLAICSAANASAVSLVLDMLVGADRLAKFDVILAGDIVSRKKPDPMIYTVALEKLGLQPENCVVIEDSQIGVQAAVAAGIPVFVTYTPYTAKQTFDGAEATFSSLGDPDLPGCSEIVTMETLFASELK
jgi:HAD superfamily hydrolase (TIGR01509 family)